MATMHEMIARNKRNTWLLIIIFALLITAIGYVFGCFWGSPIIGLILAGVAAVAMTLIAFFGGSSALLFASKAKEIR
ncbi:unnamed protein product, partial [marine sediment metagenome]